MAYRGLGADCSYQSTVFKPPHLGAGKGCPSGLSQVKRDLGTSLDANGKTVCTTQLSCEVPPDVRLPPANPPTVEASYPEWAPWAAGALALGAVVWYFSR